MSGTLTRFHAGDVRVTASSNPTLLAIDRALYAPAFQLEYITPPEEPN
jgi:hypothetical protein